MSSSSNDVCVVCLEVSQDVCQVYPCRHQFDRKCIKEWLMRKPCCPVCRTLTDKVVDKEGIEVWTPTSFSILRRTPSPRFRRALALRRDSQTDRTESSSTSNGSRMISRPSSISDADVSLCLRLLLDIAVQSTFLNLTEVLTRAVMFTLPKKQFFKS